MRRLWRRGVVPLPDRRGLPESKDGVGLIVLWDAAGSAGVAAERWRGRSCRTGAAQRTAAAAGDPARRRRAGGGGDQAGGGGAV